MLRCFLPSLATCLLLLPNSPVRGADDQFFDSNGVKIHYTVQGKGEPVLLIHGFTASIPFQWELPGIIKALAKDYQVIALDCRGHGRSGKPHDPSKYGMEMVEDAVRLLDHLQIKKAHVVGYSMGAMITIKLLTTHPERLLTATLGGAGGVSDDPASKRFFEELAESLDQGKGIGPLIMALTPAGQPKPTEDQLKTINQFLTASNDTKALAAVIRGWKDLRVVDDKLKVNQVPALALIGAQDPLKRGVDALDGQLANLKIVIIDDANHMTAFAKPEFVKSLKEFLAAHREGK